LLSVDPVHDFLKYAKTTKVRAHTRKVGPATVQVEEHDRSVDEPTGKLDEAALTEKKGKEIAMWKAWKDGGESVSDLHPLLRSFGPLIRAKTNVYKGKVKMIPDAAIEAEFQLRFVDALRSYDPEKGALGTYVYRYLDKAKRFIVENQNVGRIPENRVYRIKEFTSAREDLHEDLGRPPTVKEMADKLGWSNAEAERMDSELRSDFLTQGFEEDPYALTPSKSEEVLRLFKYELTGNEREVYEYLTGMGKPQTTSTGAIAKRLKMPDYKVSRLKSAIQKKLRRYLT